MRFAQLENILFDSRFQQVDDHIQLAWEELVIEAKTTSEGHASRDEEEDCRTIMGSFGQTWSKGQTKSFVASMFVIVCVPRCFPNKSN